MSHSQTFGYFYHRKTIPFASHLYCVSLSRRSLTALSTEALLLSSCSLCLFIRSSWKCLIGPRLSTEYIWTFCFIIVANSSLLLSSFSFSSCLRWSCDLRNFSRANCSLLIQSSLSLLLWRVNCFLYSFSCSDLKHQHSNWSWFIVQHTFQVLLHIFPSPIVSLTDVASLVYPTPLRSCTIVKKLTEIMQFYSICFSL